MPLWTLVLRWVWLTLAVLLILPASPVRAHKEEVHAYLVIEAIKYMEASDRYKPLLDKMRKRGLEDAVIPWNEAYTVEFLFDKCLVAAQSGISQSPPGIRINTLAREACEVDLLLDLRASVLPVFPQSVGEFINRLVVPWADAAYTMDSFVKGLVDWPGECITTKDGMSETLITWGDCLVDVVLAQYFPEYLATRFAYQSFVSPLALVVGAGTSFAEAAWGGNVAVSRIGSLPLTNFSHLQHVENQEWKLPLTNDYKGYSVLTDPAFDDLLRNGVERPLGVLLGDVLQASIDYEQSPALWRYKLNGSKLTRDDFAGKHVSKVEFEPQDNMASYGFAKALETGDLTYLGRPLHVAGDITVPFHDIGFGGKAHTDYEADVKAQWSAKRAQWIVHPKIASYLTDSRLKADQGNDRPPSFGADQLLTNGAKIVRGLGQATGDAVIAERMSIGIAAMVAVIEKYFQLVESGQRPRATTGTQSMAFSLYPYPESGHDQSDSKRYLWFKSEWTSCGQFRVTFSPFSHGSSEERLVIRAANPSGGSSDRQLAALNVDAIAGRTFLFDGSEGGLEFRHERPEGRTSWGFRISQIECVSGE